MKKIATAILSIFITRAAGTVTNKKGKAKNRDKTPDYPGGLKEFHNFINPKIHRLICYKPGAMVVTFIVDEDGSISDIETVKGISGKFDQKVREIIAKSPNWIPGMQDGKKITIQYILPLQFN